VKDYGSTYGPVPTPINYPEHYYFRDTVTGTGDVSAGGNVDLKFVVRNWSSTNAENPTGLLYKVVVSYDVVVDSDADGVCNGVDMCLGTSASRDKLTEKIGVNRHIWDGTKWITLNPGGKVKTEGPSKFDMDYTYGCSCIQILDTLKAAGSGEFGGHYKFGCTKGLVEDFHKDLSDGILNGMYFIETVTVPANKSTNSQSSNLLETGINYVLKARGTANAGDGIQFDARYSFRSGSSTVWTDLVYAYESFGATLLDLSYNGSTPWGSYNPTHNYDAIVPGTGAVASFIIYDTYYPNNTGELYVDIYAQL
jgi:hypothetical protein